MIGELADLIYITAHIIYMGCIGVWLVVQTLPWPSPGEWFGSMAIFLGLYPVRMIMKAVLPEDTVARRYKKRSKVPTTAEHQGAASIVGSHLLH